MKTEHEVATSMLELAEKNYNCSQIMMAVALEEAGRNNTDLVRSMSGLADGCGFFNETCGAMTGGAAIIAIHAARGDDSETESEHLLPMLQELGDWFQEKIGGKYQGTRCKDVAGDLVGTLEAKQICGGVVFDTYNKVNEILKSYGFLTSTMTG
jgi:C_GCAxxG_C_C family probable redox protein